MLSRPLLATLLAIAPSGAWAFGDLDCIGVETCTLEVCTPSLQVFAIAFTWPEDRADITLANTTTRLMLDPDSLGAGEMIFTGTDAAARLVLSFANGRDIAMTYRPDGDATTHTAICAHREAA